MAGESQMGVDSREERRRREIGNSKWRQGFQGLMEKEGQNQEGRRRKASEVEKLILRWEKPQLGRKNEAKRFY